ncbi:MAG: 5-(carboxyamino)imidazole ribonucleotide synthase, partial [Bacteroidota bacterium]|nr:5-(carboxyamino)imidazole ribonucleotide synthase [Bacteroidota bacterium]
MKDLFSTDLTLGILGGGQLGKMLLTETRKYDIRTKVLDPSADAPGRLSCNQFVQGDFKDFDTVYSFGKDVQYLTIEIESVNTDALEKLRDEGVSVNPSPEVIK